MYFFIFFFIQEQSVRSRNARQAVTPPPDLVDTSTLENNGVDGKTRVMQEVAKLTVRGAYKDKNDEEAERLSAIKYAPALGIRSAEGVNSTINKISKKGGPGGRKSKDKLSARQRKRQIDAIAKAESLKEVLQNKVETSKERFSEMKQRKKDWEDFNKNVVKKSATGSKKVKNDDNDSGPSNPFALLDVE